MQYVTRTFLITKEHHEKIVSVFLIALLAGCASTAQINPQVGVDSSDKSDVISLKGDKYQVLRKGSADMPELKRSAGVAAGKTCVSLGKKVRVDKEDTDSSYQNIFFTLYESTLCSQHSHASD